MKERRPMGEILVDVRNLLRKEGTMSIREISIKLKLQWRTVLKALEILEKLEIVAEDPVDRNEKDARIFGVIKRPHEILKK
jgi:Mn-dependent DtxR family transcriptional regulator